MSTEVTLPALGESVTEGTVSRWLKAVGDTVEADEPLLEVSTDKVDTEVPSPASGTLLEIKVPEDEDAEVGAVLAIIGDPSESGSAPAEAPSGNNEAAEPQHDGGEDESEKPAFNDNLYRSVEELELSVRSANCLKNADINKIYQLVSKTEAEMLKTKNFGRKSLNEIKEVLTEMGLSLGMKLEGFAPPEEDTQEGE